MTTEKFPQEKKLLKRFRKAQKLASEQAEDAALWCVNVPGDEANWITAGEAYVQQALRKLHRVIGE